jgi:hypothetical protein
MIYRKKTTGLRVVLRLVVGLAASLFVLSLTNPLIAEDVTSHQGRFWNAEPVSCGDTITSYARLTADLDCSGTGSTALRLEEGAKLNLNGKKVIGNFDINCIDIRGDGTKIWNGTVTQCDYGIRVRSDHNRITSVKVSASNDVGIRIQGNENRITSVKVSGSNDIGIRIEGDGNWITSAKVSGSNDRGVRIDGNENLLMWCTVTFSHTQGIKIDGGVSNKVYGNAVYDNCRDGIEIEGGVDNSLLYNQVENNGNPDTCAYFKEEYKPWFYAGIDVLAGAVDNEIKYNRAGCNLGCVGSDDFPCTARERDFWDENVDDEDNPNKWQNNRIVCNNAVPEYSPNPSD